MADIEINAPHPRFGAGTSQIIINGIDYSIETFAGEDQIELVAVGEDPPGFIEVGLRMTLAVSSLAINGEKVHVTGHFNEVSGRIKDLLEREAIKALRAGEASVVTA